MHNKNSHQSQQLGFTLLELLVVVSLLGLLSLTAVALFDNAGDQDRFEATRSRLASIRTAIIGDISRTLNGEPMLSGYVADMGRLPSNIAELLSQNVGGVSQVAWKGWDISGVSGTLYGGWRGPYLFGTPEASGTTFRDGWGTASVSPTNYNDGWNVSLSGTAPDHDAMDVQSLGSDGQLDGTDYAEDFPASGTGFLIEPNQWQLGASSVVFNVEFSDSPSPPTNPLKLVIYAFLDDGINPAGVVQEESVPFNLSVSATGVQTQSTSIEGPLPMGKYAAAVWCTNDLSGTSLTNVFDGDCATTNSKYATYFTLLPSEIPPIKIRWNTP